MTDIKSLFEAGAHFGHKTSRWHPKMAPYIHSARSGVHIINLEKTIELLEPAVKFVEQTTASNKQILFVGTKRQAQEIVEKAGEEAGMPFVSVRWFGGMLTNLKTMQQRIKRLKDLETKMASGELASRYNKLEVQRFQEEIDRLNRDFGGIRDMAGTPGVVFVADIVSDHNAVSEANKLGIPVVGIVDSNADPSKIDYPIPANDDAVKCVQIIVDEIVAAAKNGAASARAKSAAQKETAAEKTKE